MNLLTGIESSTQLELVKEIAYRMRDPDAVRTTVLHPNNHNPQPLHDSSPWGGISLEGYAGPLLLFAELDQLFPKEQWDTIVHLYVLKIKATLEKEGLYSLPPSLFGGLAGVCFALERASKDRSRYQRLLNILSEHLREKVEKDYIVPLKDHLSNGKPPPMHLYDLIQGIVGVGIYSLNSFSDHRQVHFVEEIIHILIRLTQDILVEGEWVPGWLVPSRYQHREQDQLHYPSGNFNLGLSHGITGVLAFLSVALLRGISVEGQKEAIEKIATWLKGFRKESQDTYFWPPVVPFEEAIAASTDRQSPFSGRDAWCYGTPGVARTLFLAGEALKNETLKTFAVESFCTIFQRSREQWWLPGPTCCHGIAGLLLLTLQMANDTQEKDLKEQVVFLNQLLLKFYQPEHSFGFKDYNPCFGEGYAQLDHVGLLEGSTGVLLTLMSVVTSTSWWHAPFLVSYGK